MGEAPETGGKVGSLALRPSDVLRGGTTREPRREGKGSASARGARNMGCGRSSEGEGDPDGVVI